MPIFAELAAATCVRHGEDAAPLEEREQRWAKRGIERDAVRTVRLEPGGMRAIERHPAFVDDRKRDHRAVRAFRFHFFRFDSGIIDRRWWNETGIGELARFRIEHVPERRFNPRSE